MSKTPEQPEGVVYFPGKYPLKYEDYSQMTTYIGSTEGLLVGKLMQALEMLNLPAKQDEAAKKTVKDLIYAHYSDLYKYLSSWVPRDALRLNNNMYGWERPADEEERFGEGSVEGELDGKELKVGPRDNIKLPPVHEIEEGI